MSPSAYSIRRREQILALASPVRQEIVDTVQALGRCSVADIARELGRPADSLYYHVKTLLAVELLETAGERRKDRHAEVLYATRSPESQMRLSYEPGDPANVEAVSSVVAGMLRTCERDFARAFALEPTVEGPLRNLWASRAKAWLSDQDLAEMNRLIEKLQEIFDRVREPGRDRLHSFAFVIAPVEAREVRRDDS